MTFNIITFGCKVNQCESENLHESMVRSGFVFEKDVRKADVVIINSCTVTAESDRKLRQTISRIRKHTESLPNVIVLAGCMPQADPEAARALKDIDIVVGNINKNSLPLIIKNYLKNHTRFFEVESFKDKIKFEKNIINYEPNRSRAFLKIQDGCNRFCSYCIIPYARGRVRSKSLLDIKNDAKMLAFNGYKEIVLVGINLSSYGYDLGYELDDAIETVAMIDGIERIRLGSLEPDLMTDRLIERLANQPKLCPQFHLSLQSGSNEILDRMRRRYTREEYICLANKLKSKFKNATLTTDIMVGFPGETDKNFDDTLKIIQEVGFLKVHVFPYSPRPGTPAANMENQISRSVKSERVKEVIELSNKISKMVLNDFFSKSMNVLYETRNVEGLYEGYTENYIYVRVKSDEDIRGKIVSTCLKDIDENFCKGYLSSLSMNNND